jgi:nucleoside-diphosphate-sugar epimerase
VAEESIPFRKIAETIGAQLDLPVIALSPEEAEAHFGWFARFAGFDLAASSARTRALLGWEPTQPDLLTDMVENGYFDV